MRALLLLLFGLTLGCGQAQYVLQAGVGQLDMSLRARPLADAIADQDTRPEVRALLEEVPRIKHFGEEHGLKPTRNYQRYADLQRPAAVWVVSACDPLRFVSTTWWFPISGSVPYLGFFHRDDAARMKDYLESLGLDADVRGAEAYSTIGWFDDPILSTMFAPGDLARGELANVVLHESVHATVYFTGQAAFNESVASFIADHLTLVYLANDDKARRAFVEDQDESDARHAILLAAHDELAALYASRKSDAAKLEEKKRILTALRVKVKARRPLNNATLAEVRTYGSGMKGLEALLHTCGGDYPRLIKALKAIDAKNFHGNVDKDLDAILLPIAARGCPE